MKNFVDALQVNGHCQVPCPQVLQIQSGGYIRPYIYLGIYTHLIKKAAAQQPNKRAVPTFQKMLHDMHLHKRPALKKQSMSVTAHPNSIDLMTGHSPHTHHTPRMQL